MRARAARQSNETTAGPGQAGAPARPLPVQSMTGLASPPQRYNLAEPGLVGQLGGHGAGFGDVPIFPDQREVIRGQGGSPLPAQFRQRMETAFGSDFSNVRVHQGPAADSLGALAFTQGRDIHFAPGQYNPANAEGQRIIAHELAHVVQQRQGRVAIPWGAGVPVNDDASLELVADTMGAGAVQGESMAAYVPRQVSGLPVASPGVAPVQGFSRFFGRNSKKSGGKKYQKLDDEDDLIAQEMAQLQKSQGKALKSQTKANISKHYDNLHPTASRASKIAKKVGKGASYLGKGVTLLSGGTDLGISTMAGKGLETVTKGTTKGVEMYQKHQDFQDPLTREQATPLIPKANPKSNVQSKVEVGGTIAKGALTVGNEVSEFFGGPALPTKQFNQGIDLATKTGSKLAQNYDERANQSNMETGAQFQQNQELLEEYQQQQEQEQDWVKF